MGRAVMRMWKRACVLAVVAGLAMPVGAKTKITFDGVDLPDGLFTPGKYVTDQYAGLGVTFTSALALVSGIGLNDDEAPPHSGDTVLSAASLLNMLDPDASLPQFGPLTTTFSGSLPTVVGAYFTYEAPLFLSFFDAAGGLLGGVDSRFASNLGSSGNAPNELLEFRAGGGIGSFQIEGDGFFVLDDLTFSREVPVTGVPEPGTLLLVAAGVVGLARRRGLAAG